MTRKTLTAIGNDLLGIVHEFCPTGIEQRQCTEIYWAHEQNERGSGVKAMAGILYDGLAHGNWPWVATNGS